MENQTYNVSPDKDYILSCATLFSELGFPKSAFIKMVGNEYASDIFELLHDGSLVMGANVFTYPQRDKRKKRINNEAKKKFYIAVYSELYHFISNHLQALGVPLMEQLSNSLPSSINIQAKPEAQLILDKKTLRYHTNLGRFLCGTLIRCIDKMPLNNLEIKKVNILLGWYYWALHDSTKSTMAFDNQLREDTAQTQKIT